MIPIGHTVTLNKGEQEIAKKIAKERYESSRAAGVYNAKKGDQSNEFTDLEGISGEIAFCKMFNVYPDMDSKVVTQLDDIGDCTYRGYQVDVKTTSYENGKLICATWKNDKVDMYALMVGTFPTYSFRGFASAKTLKQQSNIVDLGKGKVYAIEQKQLNQF